MMETPPLDQPQTNFEPPKRMPLGKVALINFGIMLLYMSLTSTMDTSGGGGEAALGVMAVDAVLILLHAGIAFVLGLIFVFTDIRHVGQALLISSLLVGAVGFGLCIGKAAAFG